MVKKFLLFLIILILTSCTTTNKITSLDKTLVTPSKINPSPKPTSELKLNNETSFLGTLLAHETIDIAANTEGVIDKIYVNLGDKVGKNTLIATLEAKSIQREITGLKVSLEVENAGMKKQEIVLKEARERRERRVELVQKGIISQEQLLTIGHEIELAQADLEITNARINEKKVKIKLLEEQLAELEIYSPFNGTVLARHQNPGAVINRGTPIVSLIKSDDLWIRFAVPAKKSQLIQVGMLVTAKLEGTDLVLPTTIKQISPSADNMLQMIIIEAKPVIPDEARKQIRPGMVVNVFLPNG
jgi:RND family efflux transporter MFP subunit